MDIVIKTLGWAGSLMVLLAYGLNATQKISSDSWLFYGLNLAGGTLLVVYTLYLDAHANTFLNAVWVIIAVWAIAKKVRKP